MSDDDLVPVNRRFVWAIIALLAVFIGLNIAIGFAIAQALR